MSLIAMHLLEIPSSIIDAHEMAHQIERRDFSVTKALQLYSCRNQRFLIPFSSTLLAVCEYAKAPRTYLASTARAVPDIAFALVTTLARIAYPKEFSHRQSPFALVPCDLLHIAEPHQSTLLAKHLLRSRSRTKPDRWRPSKTGPISEKPLDSAIRTSCGAI